MISFKSKGLKSKIPYEEVKIFRISIACILYLELRVRVEILLVPIDLAFRQLSVVLKQFEV